jgi:hypothetical protein
MKYVYVGMDRTVHEIIPEYVETFPGMAADKRYSPDFLKKCLPVPDEVAVEVGMEYKPLENQFVWPESQQLRDRGEIE